MVDRGWIVASLGDANTRGCGLGWVDLVEIDNANGIDWCCVVVRNGNMGIGLFLNVGMGRPGPGKVEVDHEQPDSATRHSATRFERIHRRQNGQIYGRIQDGFVSLEVDPYLHLC